MVSSFPPKVYFQYLKSGIVQIYFIVDGFTVAQSPAALYVRCLTLT